MFGYSSDGMLGSGIPVSADGGAAGRAAVWRDWDLSDQDQRHEQWPAKTA
jgi:hypothetical protein